MTGAEHFPNRAVPEDAILSNYFVIEDPATQAILRTTDGSPVLFKYREGTLNTKETSQAKKAEFQWKEEVIRQRKAEKTVDVYHGEKPSTVIQQELAFEKIARAKSKTFNPEGDEYDMETALEWNMKPDSSGHWGSVVPVDKETAKDLGISEHSYLMLKGAKHKTYNKAVAAEIKRGYRIVKKRNRYYSIPNEYIGDLDEIVAERLGDK